MGKYPLFQEVLNTINEVRPNWMDEVSALEREAESCKKGKEYSIDDHTEKLVLAMLSCQRRWQDLVPHIENGDIPTAFYNYDSHKLKTVEASVLYNRITAENIRCGNRRIDKQTACLAYDIVVLEEMYKENIYDIKHGYYAYTHNNDGTPNLEGIIKIIKLLAEGASNDYSNPQRFKMKEMGVALVCEYIKGFGVNVVKPDTHVCRILGRLGFSNNKKATLRDVSVYDAIKICNDIATDYQTELLKYGVSLPPAILVDTIIWQFGAEKKAEVCTKKHPNCSICKVKCPYYNQEK